ncbi:MAG: c-type cytochrome [Candidatus Electronema sp. VV]
MKLAIIGVAAACLLVSGSAFASEELAKANNCMGCHQMEQKGVGPSLKDIANKYKGDAEGAKTLEASIMKGSKDKWGTMPMAAQANVKEADAKTLAAWILSLAAAEAK